MHTSVDKKRAMTLQNVSPQGKSWERKQWVEHEEELHLSLVQSAGYI